MRMDICMDILSCVDNATDNSLHPKKWNGDDMAWSKDIEVRETCEGKDAFRRDGWLAS